MASKQRIYLTPTPVRMWHWLNAFGIITLCVTGAEIRFPEYVQVLGNYKAAVRVHDAAGIVVALSFALWFVYYAFIARNLIRVYFPTRRELRHDMLRQVGFYAYRYFRGEPNPHHVVSTTNKFNPMQKLAYVGVMFICTPLVIITGLLLMNVEPLRQVVLWLGGLQMVVTAHWLLACVFCAFLFVHIYLATLGHTPFAHFKPMWTGWEELSDHEAEDRESTKVA